MKTTQRDRLAIPPTPFAEAPAQGPAEVPAPLAVPVDGFDAPDRRKRSRAIDETLGLASRLATMYIGMGRPDDGLATLRHMRYSRAPEGDKLAVELHGRVAFERYTALRPDDSTIRYQVLPGRWLRMHVERYELAYDVLRNLKREGIVPTLGEIGSLFCLERTVNDSRQIRANRLLGEALTLISHVEDALRLERQPDKQAHDPAKFAPYFTHLRRQVRIHRDTPRWDAWATIERRRLIGLTLDPRQLPRPGVPTEQPMREWPAAGDVEREKTVQGTLALVDLYSGQEQHALADAVLTSLLAATSSCRSGGLSAALRLDLANRQLARLSKQSMGAYEPPRLRDDGRLELSFERTRAAAAALMAYRDLGVVPVLPSMVDFALPPGTAHTTRTSVSERHTSRAQQAAADRVMRHTFIFLEQVGLAVKHVRSPGGAASYSRALLPAFFEELCTIVRPSRLNTTWDFWLSRQAEVFTTLAC